MNPEAVLLIQVDPASQAEQAAFDVAAKEVFATDAPPPELTSLGVELLAEFNQAELDRRLTEDRWLRNLRAYKGQYDPDVLAKIGPVRSKAFVRKTRVKIKTIDSRVADLLFPAGGDKNWTIEATPKPSVSEEQKGQVIQRLKQLAQAQAQASGQPPQRIDDKLIDDAILELAKEAAAKMSNLIDDQLVEARYKESCLKTIHSGHLYGTGILKGPLVERRVRTRFVFERQKWVTKTDTYTVPFVENVPVWRWYPDMAATRLQDCRYVYERHIMTQSDLAALAERKTFDRAKIIAYIKAHPTGELRQRYSDNELKIIGERLANQGQSRGMFEILERWGWLTGTQLKNVGIDIPEDRLHETFFSNVWLLPSGEVVKAVLQPINGVTWPYHLYSFDHDETSIFAEGVASVMEDEQTNLNAARRMKLDNAALTAGPMVEVVPTLLSGYDRMDEIAPWKVWVRNASQPGAPAIRAIELPSKLAELNMLEQTFDVSADEVTAIPRYMSGENATSGAAGTASGMSMLMGAANIVVKDLVSAWDEGVTVTFLKSLYRWNMQFHPDNSVKGDLDVKARGSSSLVAKEVRGRVLNEFALSVSNPMDAPYIKRDKLLRQRAEASELSDVVKTEEEVLNDPASQVAQQQQELANQLQQVQLMTAQANAAKLQAQAEQIKAATAREAAEIELVKAKAIGEKVSAVYAALQAGGVATASPHIAPAGDEILRSSNWKDATPEPGIADLNAQAVQGSQPAMGLVQAPERAPTGMVGEHGGIETQRIEGPQA